VPAVGLGASGPAPIGAGPEHHCICASLFKLTRLVNPPAILGRLGALTDALGRFDGQKLLKPWIWTQVGGVFG